MLSGRKFKYEILQNAADGVGDGNAIECTDEADGNFETLCLQVSGTFTATVTFEGSVDGTSFHQVEAVNLSDGTPATTATAEGIYRINTLGLSKVRAKISAYTSGNVTVVGLLAA